MADGYGKWQRPSANQPLPSAIAISLQPSAVDRPAQRFGARFAVLFALPFRGLAAPHPSAIESIEATCTLARSSASILDRSRSFTVPLSLCSFSCERRSTVPLTRTCLPTSGSSVSLSADNL